jgi:hypothetical protein
VPIDETCFIESTIIGMAFSSIFPPHSLIVNAETLDRGLKVVILAKTVPGPFLDLTGLPNE